MFVQICGWIVQHWVWVVAWPVVGLITTYLVFRTQTPRPVKLGQNGIEFNFGLLLVWSLLIVFWPINLFLLLWIRVGGD